MQNWSWWLRATIIALVLAVLFLLSFTVSFTAPICAPNEYTHAKECLEYHIGPFALVWIARVVDSHSGVVSAIATVFLTVLTGLLAYLARLQYTSSRTQLSAFVFIEEVRPFFEINANEPQPADKNEPRNVSGWAFRPIWRNSGETQTKNMRTHVDCELRDMPLPCGFKFSENFPQDVRMLMGPKSVRTGGSPRTFTVAEMQDVKDGKRLLYMWGWVRYETVFVPGASRITRYCCQVQVVGDPAKADCTFQYPTPNEGNCSDDECVVQGLI